MTIRMRVCFVNSAHKLHALYVNADCYGAFVRLVFLPPGLNTPGSNAVFIQFGGDCYVAVSDTN